MKCFSTNPLLLLLLCSLWKLSLATRVRGTIQYSADEASADTFNHYYLSRFGVAAGSSVYVFGTVTLIIDRLIPLDSQMLLVLIPQSVTDNLVRFIDERGSSVHCSAVIPAVLNDSISVDHEKCYSGFNDYLRKVPCDIENGGYASCNQPEDKRVIYGNDFTFHIDPAPDTEYYYLFLLACKRNTTVSCTWDPTRQVYFDYDISLVNAANLENNSHFDPFTYQFSYDLEGALIILMVFSAAYAVVIVTHVLLHTILCANDCKMHRLTAIFTMSLFIEFLHVAFEMVHMAVFAGDGIGAVWCNYIGEVFNQFSDWLLILVMLLIGRGWMITTSTLRSKKITFALWGAYVFFFSIYFIWTVVSIDTSSDSWAIEF